MTRVHIVTDSTADLSPEIIQQYGITVLPARVIYGDEVYRDGIDIGLDELFTRAAENIEYPKTSQPPIGDFLAAFRTLLENGGEILGIFVSGALSGTVTTAQMAANQIDPEHITIVDSKSLSWGISFQILEAVELLQQGLSRLEVSERLKKLQSRIHQLIYLDTLDFVRRSGRLSNFKALLGSILKIKPILETVDGRLEVLKKVRGSKQAYRLLLQEMKKRLGENYQALKVVIGEGWAREEAVRLKEAIAEQFKCEMLEIMSTGIGIGSHSGPGVIGLTFYAK